MGGIVDSAKKTIKHPCFLIGKEVQLIFLILFFIYYMFNFLVIFKELLKK
jgi:hypothetical protein